MSIKVSIPVNVNYGSSLNEINVSATSISSVIEHVVNKYPELKPKFLTPFNEMVNSLIIFVNGERVSSSSVKSVILNNGDEVDFIFAIAGGESVPHERYARQMILEKIGVQGQNKLLLSRILIIGAGGLGVPLAMYLTGAGVGTIGLVDADYVDVTNLTRQLLYIESDIGRSKVECAIDRLRPMNPDVIHIPHNMKIDESTAEGIINDYDLVINSADNFETRYIVNDACMFLNKPLIDVAAVELSGQIALFTRESGCYRCLFPEPSDLSVNCSSVGVLGTVCGYMGTRAATEAIKLILGMSRFNWLETYNALTGQHKRFSWSKNKECPICSSHTFSSLIQERISSEGRYTINPQEFLAVLGNSDTLIVDVRDKRIRSKDPFKDAIPFEHVMKMGRTFVQNVPNDVNRIICVCQVGIQSKHAARFIQELGYTNTYNLNGGLNSLATRVNL
ncbi:ThiF family adenylyltransferase [Alicyclobacillus suci]|uniref:ThiF family adenylyltransferase n=1 Tax=Alicyclobacillus suci TaxID=2816080 RepID=UPI001A8E175B|nr:ThiF family adenylyltransferase [Alicyclobacillus suci]